MKLQNGNGLTKSLEDYLEAVLELSFSNRSIRVKHITDRMNVKNSSAISALKKLQDAGHIYYEKHRYIYLEPGGIRAASKIYSKHKVIQRYFREVACLETKKAFKAACELEHILDDKDIEKLKKALSTRENEKDKKKRRGQGPINLILMEAASNGLIKSIDGRMPVADLKKGDRIFLERISPDRNIFEVFCRGCYVYLGQTEAKKITVE